MTLMRLMALILCLAALVITPGESQASPGWEGPPCINLIANGNFEEDGGWEMGKTPKMARYSTDKSHEGSRSMLLGNLNPQEDVFSFSSIWQDITIPPEAYEVTLNFWYLAISQDPEGLDEQKVVLINPDDNSILGVPWKRRGSTGEWRSESLPLPNVPKGKKIRIYFGVFNDGDGKPSAMYLDEVSVMACVQPTP
ncbi:MAG TPA: hypothetical protein ENG33_07765, partial [Chloroflexi bacterium]|nr:hypothetical protein [Chloroflexota bacterium]